MSVNSHLVSTASKLIITDNERATIDGHIASLKTKLNSYFEKDVITEQFAFGSYTRKTLMPRKADPYSDVDYMIVFSDSKYSTSTYLKWLRDFADSKYSSSEIYRSHPTIVLELSKIIIELVPATKSTYDSYQIPAPSSSYTKWMDTHPNSFNTLVRNKNTTENKMIRPLIRLMKYWNAKNDYVYSSYELEQLIVSQSYFLCSNTWEYVRKFVGELSTYNLPEYKSDKVKRLQTICTSARNYELISKSELAETEIKKAFPEY